MSRLFQVLTSCTKHTVQNIPVVVFAGVVAVVVVSGFVIVVVVNGVVTSFSTAGHNAL